MKWVLISLLLTASVFANGTRAQDERAIIQLRDALLKA